MGLLTLSLLADFTNGRHGQGTREREENEIKVVISVVPSLPWTDTLSPPMSQLLLTAFSCRIPLDSEHR